VPRGHALPVAGAALSRRAPGQRLRSRCATAAPCWSWSTSTRALSRPRRAAPHHPHAARADHVQPHAEGAEAARSATTRARSSSSCTPRALSDTGERADDRLVGPDHPRVLRRDRRARLHRLRHRPSGWRTAAPSVECSWASCTCSAADMRPVPQGSRASSGSRRRRPSSTSTTPNARKPAGPPTAR
jgi:hypothetical protein